MKHNFSVALKQMLADANVSSEAYVRVEERLRQHRQDTNVYPEMISGWHAVAYRLLSCTNNSKVFSRSIVEDGDAPPYPARYTQDQCLFDFFINGVSAIESFCYTLHCIAFLLDNERSLSMDDKTIRYITPVTVLKHFSKMFQQDQLTVSLKKAVNASTFKEWKRIRNILIHRGMPGRKIFRSVSSPNQKPTKWQIGIELNMETTSERLIWLKDSLNAMFSNLLNFIEIHFPLRKELAES